jgi:hypothetical protein
MSAHAPVAVAPEPCACGPYPDADAAINGCCVRHPRRVSTDTAHPSATDHASRDRRDEDLRRTVGGIATGRAARARRPTSAGRFITRRRPDTADPRTVASDASPAADGKRRRSAEIRRRSRTCGIQPTPRGAGVSRVVEQFADQLCLDGALARARRPTPAGPSVWPIARTDRRYRPCDVVRTPLFFRNRPMNSSSLLKAFR